MPAALIPSPGASLLLALEGRGHPSQKDLFLPGSWACRAVASLALAMEQTAPGNQWLHSQGATSAWLRLE